VKASTLVPHPLNWRKHPQRQQELLRSVLAQVGYADALLARELPDGKLQLIDGHLRAETTPDQEVPVLVLDVTENEARTILLTSDPLAALAETDGDAIDQLIKKTELSDDLMQWLSPEKGEEEPQPIREWSAEELILTARFVVIAPVELQAKIRGTLLREFPKVKFNEDIF
jgi:hypothetical protein